MRVGDRLATKGIGLRGRVSNSSKERERPVPAPFLRVPFEVGRSNLAPVMAGWTYSQEDIKIHGIKFHGAIDWALPLDTPVLAAADGYAVAFWDERWIVEETEGGSAHRLQDGKPMTFGQGLTVQIYHGNSRYTQYGHLSHLPADSNIRFYPSKKDEDGNYLPHEIRNALVREYQRPAVARRVKAGEVIGYVGDTGNALGQMGYEAWRSPAIPRLVTPQAYEPPQLHFVVFRRSLKSRAAVRYDPFGIYDVASQYTPDVREWGYQHKGENHPPLWLPQ